MNNSYTQITHKQVIPALSHNFSKIHIMHISYFPHILVFSSLQASHMRNM